MIIVATLALIVFCVIVVFFKVYDINLRVNELEYQQQHRKLEDKL